MAAEKLSAAGICEVAEIPDQARALLQPDMPPQRYVEVLAARAAFADAVKFLAHALPKREAVWWAWFCARRASGPNPAPVIQACLSATEKWIAQPNEENRRAAMKAAEAAQLGTPAGCAGLGAFFSGGSLAPPEAPVVPPGEFMTARAVAGAVTMSAVAAEPEKAPEKYRAFIAQGIEVAHKIGLWPKNS
jgi:hypothetical protein